MTLTIGIKALNEEEHIAAAVVSALAAARPWDGEVIVADSGSNDRTVEIAQSLGVRVVQLANPAEKSCGAGAQLAYQHAKGEYFYLLDADMVLEPDFMLAAVTYLNENPSFAAVGGRVNEVNVQGHDFSIRANHVTKDRNPGVVDRLDCGGLYRMTAIREVNYFSDRNLHSFEEFDLGARLRGKGWQLARIDVPAINHHGYTKNGYRLLWNRLKSGYAGGVGEVLRGAIGKDHFSLVIAGLSNIRISAVVILWWLLLVSCFAVSFPIATRITLFVLLILAPTVLLSLRRRSVRLGLYSLIAWNVSALGLITGLFRSRIAPEEPLASINFGPGHGADRAGC